MSHVVKMRTQTRKRTSKPKKATGTIIALDAAMARPMSVIVRKPNPLQPIRALYTRLPSMDGALAAILRHYGQTAREQPGKLGAHSIAVHEDRCPFGVVMWPRASNGTDLEEMRDAVTERDAECRCQPLIMYAGATA